jgi:hypothetical protein
MSGQWTSGGEALEGENISPGCLAKLVRHFTTND